jgi:hypothetical protein
LSELKKRTSLILVNSHFSLNNPRPTVPGFIEVGGLHIQTGGTLPEVSSVRISGLHAHTQHAHHNEILVITYTANSIFENFSAHQFYEKLSADPTSHFSVKKQEFRSVSEITTRPYVRDTAVSEMLVFNPPLFILINYSLCTINIHIIHNIFTSALTHNSLSLISRLL